jgi:hypothetical protein
VGLTTGPLSSSSSPFHFFTGGLATTTGAVVFFVVSSSEASQSSDIAKPAQRMRKRKGKGKREWVEIRSKVPVEFLSSSSLNGFDQRGLPNIPTSPRAR